MKVLITTDWYKPTINGVVTSVVNLAEGLEALGAQVRILTLSGSRHSYREGNVTYLGSIGVGKIYPQARLRTAPSGDLLQELAAWNPDVVHSQCEFSTFFAARKIAEACGCPLIHTYHTVYEDFTHYFSPNIRFGKYLAAVFSGHVLGQTDGVIVPTGKIEEMLRGYGVDKPIAVIPSGLKLEQFNREIGIEERNALRSRLGIKRDDRVLVYLGRLAKEKNVDELLSFAAAQPDESFKLLLVGDGPCRSRLEENAENLGLSSRVIFAGMVPPEEVAAYYSLGDLFVSASQSETQGLTYIEAMAAGLPLLCREDPCLADVVEDGKNGYTYTDEKTFRERLQLLLTSDSMREKLAREAKETALRKFSAGGFAARVLKEYEKILAKKKPVQAA